ncbi:exp1-like protein [Podila clonocystis]|nr:exp1-like protein [Podila clonocystis]
MVKSAATPKPKKDDSLKASATKVKKEAAPKVAKPKKVAAIAMPKRPSTPWNLFFMDHLEKVRAEGRAVVPTVEGAAASALWKELSPEQKQVYQDKYQANYAVFKQQTSDRLQELTPAEYNAENARRKALREAGRKGLPSLKDPNAPKRPLSSFFRFAKDQRESGKYAHLPLKEQAKAFADAWGSAADDIKAHYTELARSATEQYKIEKAAYDARI